MREAIEKVLEAMREDYKRWTYAAKGRGSFSNLDIEKKMTEEYCNGLELTEGRRYWKIISTNNGGHSRSVCGFIVKAGDKKFREGHMLKPAGWAAPARNFARGNVLDGDLHGARWTGIG